jgi:hypothetical protein
MKGFITRALATACGAALLAASTGCCTYDDLVDPCYPQRYVSMARHEVNEASAPQIHNGHILDQTVWNWMFEPGSDRLLPGGLDHLAYLTRRRPAPDCQVFLQTAQDVAYDPAYPEKLAECRCDLDAKRIAAVQKYLTAETAGRHIDIQVTVIDPSDPGIAAIPANLAVQKMYAGSMGVLAGAAGGAAASGPTGGGGAAGGGR